MCYANITQKEKVTQETSLSEENLLDRAKPSAMRNLHVYMQKQWNYFGSLSRSLKLWGRLRKRKEELPTKRSDARLSKNYSASSSCGYWELRSMTLV